MVVAVVCPTNPIHGDEGIDEGSKGGRTYMLTIDNNSYSHGLSLVAQLPVSVT